MTRGHRRRYTVRDEFERRAARGWFRIAMWIIGVVLTLLCCMGLWFLGLG